jgi:hypothetical protein
MFVKTTSQPQWPALNIAILAISAVSFAAGAILRVVAAQNDLWFDEIWTLELLRERVHSVGDLFINFKHSNNHHLCSLWMWLIGQDASAFMYRLPSVLASIGTVVLAGLLGARRCRLEGCIAVILTSWSYLLIHFGTEARGYSLAIFFALLAWYALQRFDERKSSTWRTVFWCTLILGFLAHLEFAVCFAGLLVWSLWRVVRNQSKWRQGVLDLFALFTVPTVLVLVFYYFAIRGMEVGGGPTYRLWPLLIKTASYTLGGPASGAAAGIVALLAVAIICVALIYLIFDRDDRWIFYAAVIVAPLVLIAIKPPEQLYVRYFLISVAFSLVLLSSGCAAVFRRGFAGIIAGLTLMAIFVTANAFHTVKLLRFGRGQYLAALHFIETHSKDQEVLITSDHDFRNGNLVNFYKHYLDRPDRTRYLNAATLQQEYVRTNGSSLGAEWLILHRFDLTETPERVVDNLGNSYRLVSIYQYSDLSGWNWLLYHNLNRPAVTSQKPPLR